MEAEVLTGLTEIMDQQAEARRAAFVAIEDEKNENIRGVLHGDGVNASIELKKAEINYDDEEAEKLKEEMDAAEQALLKKRDELKKHKGIFKQIFFREHHLGQADRELADLESEYKKIKEQYKVIMAKINSVDVAELSMDDVEILPGSDDYANNKDQGVYEIFKPEEFIEKTRSYFRYISNSSEAIFNKYPELRGISRAEVAKMRELFPEEAIAQLEELQKAYKSFYREYWMALFDNNLDLEILDMNANEYVSSYKEDKIVKIFNILSSAAISDKASFIMIDPMPDETVAAWSRRLFSFMLKSK